MDKVWVLRVEHKHGDNIEVHRSFSGAHRSLIAYVDQNWPDSLPPENATNERIAVYFSTNDDEFYSIDQIEVED